MSLFLVAAVAENFCIGKNNEMPWYIPEDFKHFKSLTLNKPVIMGRKTFQSIVQKLGKPLPGRTNIVISKSGFEYEGVTVLSCLLDAIEHAKKLSNDVAIIGGANVYTQAMPMIDKMEITFVHKPFDGDAFFPHFSEEEWEYTRRDFHEGDPAYTFSTLTRKEVSI